MGIRAMLDALVTEHDRIGSPLRGSRAGADDAPIWRVAWPPNPRFETIQVAPSLEWFVVAIVELFRAGAYRWDRQNNAVVIVDAVFEARGLGELCRPPVASDG